MSAFKLMPKHCVQLQPARQLSIALRFGSQHTDSVLNNGLGILIGCMHPSPMDHLPIFSDIHPAEFSRLGATLFLANCETLYPDYIIYGLLSDVSYAFQVRLRSRRPLVAATRKPLTTSPN